MAASVVLCAVAVLEKNCLRRRRTGFPEVAVWLDIIALPGHIASIGR
jgi:hypothetical protein